MKYSWNNQFAILVDGEALVEVDGCFLIGGPILPLRSLKMKFLGKKKPNQALIAFTGILVSLIPTMKSSISSVAQCLLPRPCLKIQPMLK